jgi:hypothetical protein
MMAVFHSAAAGMVVTQPSDAAVRVFAVVATGTLASCFVVSTVAAHLICQTRRAA